MNEYSKYFVGSGTKRVNLEDGNWVEIKEELSTGDWEKIDSSMLQYVAESNGGNRQERRRLSRGQGDPNQVTNLRIRGGTIEVLEALIVSWSFQGVPVNRNSISKLKEAWTEKILAAADEEGLTESPLVVQDSGPE